MRCGPASRRWLVKHMAAWTALATTVLPARWVLAAEGDPGDTARTTVVIDLSADEKENAEFMLEVRRAVAEHRTKRGSADFTLIDVNGPLNAGGETKDRTNIATAQGFAQAGKASADRKDWVDAADQYESARKLFEESLAVSEDPAAIYGPLVVKLGEAQLLGGDVAASKDPFQQGVFWGAPDTGLDAKAKAAYQAAKDEVASLAKGTVQVNTDPPYAEVFLDGKFVGVSPLRLVDIPVGVHIATISKPAYERATARLDVKVDKTAHKDVKLAAARRKLIFDGMRPKLEKDVLAATIPGSVKWGMGGDAVVELGTLFRSEVSVIAKVTGPPETKTLELFVFHVPSQRLVATSETPGIDWSFQNGRAVTAAVQKALDIDWVRKLGGEVEGPRKESGGITSKWWFWTLIGVAVAGGTTAVVLATQGDDAPPPFETTKGTGAVVMSF